MATRRLSSITSPPWGDAGSRSPPAAMRRPGRSSCWRWKRSEMRRQGVNRTAAGEQVARGRSKPPRRATPTGSKPQAATLPVTHESGLHHVIRELHAQREALRDTQEALERSRNRYAELFDFAPIAYVVLDERGVIENTNLNAAALLGVNRAHATGLPFILFVAEDEHRKFLAHLRACRDS